MSWKPESADEAVLLILSCTVAFAIILVSIDGAFFREFTPQEDEIFQEVIVFILGGIFGRLTIRDRKQP